MYRTGGAILLVLGGAVGIGAATAGGQKGGAPVSKWEAPEEAKKVKNPVAMSPEVVREGLALYKKNCLTCHGAAGKGDGPAAQFIESAPADISSPETQSRMTDGEIFWKITEGRHPMPPFKKKLSEKERWKLVNTVRTLAASS